MNIALALGAGAFFAFGLGFIVSQLNGYFKNIDGRGYDRGVAVMSAKYERETNAILKVAMEQQKALQRQHEAKTQELRQRASEAEKRANDALQELLSNDPNFAQCDAQPYPDIVRRHLPVSVLREASPTLDDSV